MTVSAKYDFVQGRKYVLPNQYTQANNNYRSSHEVFVLFIKGKVQH